MRFYRVIWKPGSENGKKGIRDDMLMEHQYVMFQKEVDLVEVCNDYEPVLKNSAKKISAEKPVYLAEAAFAS